MRLPDPLLGQVRKLEKRSGREPDVCGFESHSGQSKEIGPVVQRQRRLAYTQETVVRLHPGSLAVERCSAADNKLGLSFNGRMPALQASDPGSIPGGSTARFQI